jgi:uncharacterized protein
MKALREAWGSRIGLPAASWMLEIGTPFLRSETELVLKSRRVIPGRLVEAGFQFQFPEWESAAQHLVRRWRATDQPLAFWLWLIRWLVPSLGLHRTAYLLVANC